MEAKVDIRDRLSSGEGFAIDELSMGIVPWLRRSFSQKKVVSLVVSNHAAQSRMDFIQEFISWHMHCVISRLSSSDLLCAYSSKIEENQLHGLLLWLNEKHLILRLLVTQVCEYRLLLTHASFQ